MSDKNYHGQWRKVPTTTGVFTLSTDPIPLAQTEDHHTGGVEFYAHTNEGDKTLSYKFMSFANDSAYEVIQEWLEGDMVLIEARVYPGHLRPLLTGYWHDYRDW